ncbi:hypothetical protein B296_00056905 [Ensete ventricosum]|uniref:Uncharacterized protein n=1 Tax=Ensete ventricosum TaxID=4639 RepID=A0A426XQL5_ENSVE|nr:hypothetical protein B296_00056905 [Ensete ventricosum]
MRTSAKKGKGVVELEEVPEQGYTMRELCEGALHLTLAKQVYECSSEELMNRAGKSTILTLRATNKELKLGVNQELVAAVEHWVKELEDEAGKVRTELEFLRNQWKELEQEVRVLRSSLDGARNDRARVEGDVLSLTKAVAFLEAKLKAEGLKAVAAYKAS